MNDTLNNQLAQVCNNLYCIIRSIKCYPKFAEDTEMCAIYCVLQTEYNKLFKLIYGDK